MESGRIASSPPTIKTEAAAAVDVCEGRDAEAGRTASCARPDRRQKTIIMLTGPIQIFLDRLLGGLLEEGTKFSPNTFWAAPKKKF